MARAGWLIVVIASGAWAQSPEPDFALPTFGAADAGAPDEAPPPVTSAPPLLPEPPLVESPAPPPPPPPQPPRWAKATLSAVGLLSGLRDFYVGVEVSLAAVVRLSGPNLLDAQRQVDGWLLTLGADLLGGRISGALCAGSDFCGDRWAGGATARVGHATGFAARDGSVAVRRFWFGGVSAHVGYVSVPPAPLVAGSRFFEGVFRLKAGVEASAAGGASPRALTAVVMRVQAFIFGEVITFAPVPRGFQLGAAVGVSF